MMDNLREVDHFISDDVYKYGEYIITPLRKKNYRQMYDELNVKATHINNIELINNKYVITVFIESRYMDYILDINTGETVRGNDKSRIQINYKLTFTKDINAVNEGEAKKCPACGSPMNINDSGICPYQRVFHTCIRYHHTPYSRPFSWFHAFRWGNAADMSSDAAIS